MVFEVAGRLNTVGSLCFDATILWMSKTAGKKQVNNINDDDDDDPTTRIRSDRDEDQGFVVSDCNPR